jgi:hypothetical protein
VDAHWGGDRRGADVGGLASETAVVLERITSRG